MVSAKSGDVGRGGPAGVFDGALGVAQNGNVIPCENKLVVSF